MGTDTPSKKTTFSIWLKWLVTTSIGLILIMFILFALSGLLSTFLPCGPEGCYSTYSNIVGFILFLPISFWALRKALQDNLPTSLSTPISANKAAHPAQTAAAVFSTHRKDEDVIIRKLTFEYSLHYLWDFFWRSTLLFFAALLLALLALLANYKFNPHYDLALPLLAMLLIPAGIAFSLADFALTLHGFNQPVNGFTLMRVNFEQWHSQTMGLNREELDPTVDPLRFAKDSIETLSLTYMTIARIIFGSTWRTTLLTVAIMFPFGILIFLITLAFDINPDDTAGFFDRSTINMITNSLYIPLGTLMGVIAFWHSIRKKRGRYKLMLVRDMGAKLDGEPEKPGEGTGKPTFSTGSPTGK